MRPTKRESKKLFPTGRRIGVAIVTGKASGGLEVLDFDRPEYFGQWRELVERQRPGLVDRLPIVRTPRPGCHVFYRCAAIGQNQVLARDSNRKVISETRGEGGYVLAPGCPPSCHPSGGTYEHQSGPPLTQIPKISGEEREILLEAARSFGANPAAAENDQKEIAPVAHAPYGPAGRPEGGDLERRKQRAIDYVKRCPPAISAQGGHNATMWAARTVVWGFALGPEVGFEILWEHFNPLCVPPWSEAELRHKCEEADTKSFDKARGWLLSEDAPGYLLQEDSMHPAQAPQGPHVNGKSNGHTNGEIKTASKKKPQLPAIYPPST
jgi:hypothetical protein